MDRSVLLIELAAGLKDKYLRELTVDRTKPFKEEYARTTALEKQLLDEHGLPGAALLVQQHTKSRLPAERNVQSVVGWEPSCPWPEPAEPVADAARILAPLRSLLPSFVEALLGRLRFVVPYRRNDGWRLAYLTDRTMHGGRAHFGLFLCGAPNLRPELPASARQAGWRLPRPLASLYAVHDGIGSKHYRVSSCSRLNDLGSVMDPIAAAQGFVPRGYAFRDLLEFFPDGTGNAQCFHRQHPDDEDPPTVDWDHETREISARKSFSDFTDRRLSECVADEQ